KELIGRTTEILMKLEYDRGTLIIRGQYAVPFSTWDNRISAFRAPAFRYRDIVEFLRRSLVEFSDYVMNPPPIEKFKKISVPLREYQEEALNSWLSSGMRGVIVLPTGAGKTLIALKAMEKLEVSTLVVVPTIPLMRQWSSEIEDKLGISPGLMGGGEKDVRFVTVATYDSAYLNAELLGDKFMLAVFDEVHHLAAEGYSHIGEMLAAPYRLGLTATFEREDGRHFLLPMLVGGIVYSISPKELAGKHLAEYEIVKISVDLSEEERKEYKEAVEEYKRGLSSIGLEMRSPDDFRQLVKMSATSRTARDALLAWNRARRIAINSESKLKALENLLLAHKRDKVIIFTEFNDMAKEISKRYLIPLITHRTPEKERNEILQNFRDGIYMKIVTSKVLNEGIDVPDARVAIILGGTGSRREFVQRLGRVLRKRAGKRAVIYEVVSKGTKEVSISYRRRRGVSS
ncbi:MAG: DEAD/DEAH box helicase, partial [Candidatus Methanodesulfokora sp.]